MVTSIGSFLAGLKPCTPESATRPLPTTPAFGLIFACRPPQSPQLATLPSNPFAFSSSISSGQSPRRQRTSQVFMQEFDLVTIGGQLAKEIASEIARAGRRVAFVTNAMVHNPLAERQRDSPSNDPRRPVRRERALLPFHAKDDDLPHNSALIDAGTGAAQFAAMNGHAVFTGKMSLAIHGIEYRFKRAILAPEALIVTPTTPELQSIDYLAADNWLNLVHLPETLAIVGQGSEACELAQAFARCGCTVHLISTDSLLPGQCAKSAEALMAQLTKDGVRLHIGWSCSFVERIGGQKAISIEKHGERRKLIVEQIIVAAPRRVDLSASRTGSR